MSRLALVPVLAACFVTACAGRAPPERSNEANGSDPGGEMSTAAPTGLRPAPTSPSTLAPTAPEGGAFGFDVQPLQQAARALMIGRAWRPGCPVPLDDLRSVRLTHWGFDGGLHEGTLVIHADAVPVVRGVFAELHAARWPIRQIRPIEYYGGDDEASMDADNTSAFNCRPSTGSTSRWSEHAYGRAVDINPQENPYVTSTGVEPKAGEAFVDRTRAQPGVIDSDSVVVSAFERRGWGWGGRWSSSKDYQHFSSNSR